MWDLFSPLSFAFPLDALLGFEAGWKRERVRRKVGCTFRSGRVGFRLCLGSLSRLSLSQDENRIMVLGLYSSLLGHGNPGKGV